FGRGVMQDVSDKLLGQFVSCLERRMGTDEGPAAAGESADAAPAAAVDPPSAAPAPAAEPTAAAPSAPSAPSASSAPATPPPTSTTPATPTQARGSDDAINLGKTVLPVVIRAYWKPAVVALVVIAVIIWLLVR